ncbi:MAG: biotin--[acetyl-CoA-carboxylase] ligase [Desulfotignum sp.]|nr:biotin--[acetyl-CoA-carboxylase] ligase [Desulfotignum sp.]MCF8124690.1 biotin--[acetyl-CoA-carboxylase] ligase [Desulfotignum sp.]
MVNQIQNMRQKILAALYKENGGTVSGVQLSGITGISRVAVWKHINALKKEGFKIEPCPKGYFLPDPDDLLLPFCFDRPLSDRIFYFPQVATTMDKARELARQGVPHLSCVVAEHQTHGRGRLNRIWESGPGGLWFTLILVPDTPPPLAYLYNFAASLSLSLTLETLFGRDVRVKWPNDLLLNGKKLVGLLSEIETQADMIRFLLVGIGINVNNTPASDSFAAISLQQALGRPVSRKKILVEFLRQFTALTRDMDPAAIMGAWKKRTATIGARVRVETRHKTVEGMAMDVDDTGTLMVKDDNRQIHKIIYGDCFHA